MNLLKMSRVSCHSSDGFSASLWKNKVAFVWIWLIKLSRPARLNIVSEIFFSVPRLSMLILKGEKQKKCDERKGSSSYSRPACDIRATAMGLEGDSHRGVKSR